MTSKENAICTVQHESHVELAKENAMDPILVDRLSGLFKVLGDPTRIRILHLLSLHEMCVCDIATALDMTQSAISHQLKSLKQAGLVRNRKSGRVVYYALDDDHVSTILSQGIHHISHKYK
ncbi:MAG: ArsR family transcriptional regulator, lead/cadmium/zinc/bismuth-responsive transcriptional [Clostridiales bacterium]|jgi:ArsR family transcriptional regulator|nr:ArsR family transcriptional regulator, lead/cadmium/zinc/bismuth-responsive transcriptional [Clostridiales bacterium]